MAGPWEKYQQQPAASGPWAKYAQQPQEPQEPQEPWSGSILPVSGDEQGNWSFDSNAGLLGAAKRFFTLPGDVATGKIDPMSDDGIGRAAEFSMFASPLNPGIRAGDRAIPGIAKMLRRPNIEPPTAKTLKQVGGAGLDEARDMGVDYSAAAVRDMAQGIRSELERDGLRAELAPTSFSLLSKWDNPPEGAIATGADLIAARRSFGEAAKNYANPTDQMVARRILEGLDRFIESPGDAVLSGPAEGVSAALKRANANYSAGKRSDRLTGVGDKAERRAEASNSGHNIDNTIRQRIASLLEKPKETAGFKQSEIAALEQLSRGTVARNRLRDVGNFLGGGGGLGAMLTTSIGGATGAAAGGIMGGGIGAAIPLATGVSARALANIITKHGLSKIDKATRKRSPLYEDMQHALPLEAITPEKRAALIRTLLLTGAPQE
jgi:hypothetical protein